MELAIEFSVRLPGPFDIDLARFRYPVKYYESMNSVLHQEMIRYNRLTDVSQYSETIRLPRSCKSLDLRSV